MSFNHISQLPQTHLDKGPWPLHMLSTYVIRHKGFPLADMLEQLLYSPLVNTVNNPKSSRKSKQHHVHVVTFWIENLANFDGKVCRTKGLQRPSHNQLALLLQPVPFISVAIDGEKFTECSPGLVNHLHFPVVFTIQKRNFSML